jgi:hypothetical protein
VRKHITWLIVVGILAVAFVAAVDALRGHQSNGNLGRTTLKGAIIRVTGQAAAR